MGPFLPREELRIGRSFLLLEMTSDDQLLVAEVMLREVQDRGQVLDLALFITYSTDDQALPPGETIERHVDLANSAREDWILSMIHYY